MRTFSSLGKDHMTMETFCMGMNMPSMEKAYLEINEITEGEKAINISVSLTALGKKRI